MVDALRRTRDWITAAGRVVDLHPTAAVALIHVGANAAGPIDPGGATGRHQAASDAVAVAVHDGVFAIEDAIEFEFSTYADTLDELEAHILEDWREARIGRVTLDRARALLARQPSAAVCVRERVSAMRLRR